MIAAQVVDHTPAWLAFVGAIAVSIIAAATAQWRQRAQLRHDRELKDLDELRILLDECAQVIAVASLLFVKFVNQAYVVERQSAPPVDDSPALPDDDGEESTDDDLSLGERLERYLATARIADEDELPEPLADHQRKYLAAAEPIFGLYQRLVLRLGESHAVTQWFLALQALYTAADIRTAIHSTDPQTLERYQPLTELRDHMRAAHFNFLSECKRVVGTRIREPRRMPEDHT